MTLEGARIGFIGLGIMGKPMAKNLLRADYPLVVYNRTRSKADELLDAGAKWADSPAEAARESDVVITIVSDSPDVEEVVLGPEGVLHGAAEGLVLIDMTTISPVVARQVAEACSQKGVSMLDAPVSGGDIGAQEGTLSIMVGGEEQTFEKVRPIFEVLGENIVYMGESGFGQGAKMCNQVICGLNLLAVSEGLMLGAKQGLPLETLLQAIGGGAAGSWMLSNVAPKVIERDFSPGFMVDLQQKDLRLALETAASTDVSLPGTGLVHQLFRAVQAQGSGREGTQALVKALEALAEFEVGE